MATTTGAARAQAIVEAARACIAEVGLSGATFERIAARAGVSRGLVHYHFRSKDRLLLAVCREMCRHQTTALGEALSGSGDRAADAERMRELLMQFLAAPAGFRLLSELWTLAGRDPAVRTEVGRLYADQRSALAAAIRTAASERRSALRADPEAIATTILAVADGLSLQAHMDQTAPSSRHSRQRCKPPRGYSANPRPTCPRRNDEPNIDRELQRRRKPLARAREQVLRTHLRPSHQRTRARRAARAAPLPPARPQR